MAAQRGADKTARAKKKGSRRPKKKMGRPRIQIDFEKLDLMCAVQCTLVEIAGYFECSVDTVERAIKREKGVTFAEYFEQKRCDGKVSLRRRQYQAAMAGDRTMLVWLGKQWLGQTDRLETQAQVVVEERTPPDLSNLSDRELLTLQSLHNKINAGTGD